MDRYCPRTTYASPILCWQVLVLIFCTFSVRWGSEAPNKCRAELIQSAFLWTQYYETQLHIHRMFALKEPPDPELSTSSMIICKNAAKQCITIVESARDVLIVPFHSFLLIVSLKFAVAVWVLNVFRHV